MFKDKILLITGGTGSFGNAVLSRFISTDFKEIRIFSRDEKKQEDMRMSLKNEKVKFYIGDVRNYESISSAMVDVDYVFHAAALKQVPSCDFYPMEAIKTNVIGAENVLRACLKNNIQNGVFLSTDKAVYPINAMGLSKALMEKLVAAKSRITDNETILSCTRYGNVMGSRGSVIPLFVSQIKSGLPLTLTDPDMTRFIMSLEESVELVEFSYKKAKPGDIFVKKAPSTNLLILAKALLEIFKAKNEIKYIGTRHGEKLYETLLTREEVQNAEDLGEFFRIPQDNRDLNYAQYFTEGVEISSVEEDYNSHNAKQLNLNEMIETLMNLDFIKKELSNA